MPYSHQGSTDKINNIKREFQWKPAKARRFHDWLHANYKYEKDSMSMSRLREVARTFANQDRDLWND